MTLAIIIGFVVGTVAGIFLGMFFLIGKSRQAVDKVDSLARNACISCS